MLTITFLAQPHKSSHQNAGSDEIIVTGLSGVLADDQHVLDAEVDTLIATHASDADAHGPGVAGVDDLTDADTTTDSPALNEVLKWDGNNWVPGTAGDTDEFSFAVTEFSDGLLTTAEIGSGTWQEIGAITFTATYDNGPPASASIAISANGAWESDSGWTSDTLTMTSPYAEKATGEVTNYPGDKDKTITFTLSADGEDDTQTVTFRNQIRWGESAVGTGWSSAQIVALAGSALSNDHTRNSMSITGVGANDYLVFACPASYSNLSSANFTYDGFIVNMESAETIEVTNDSGFVEDYEVYRSTEKNLGDHTLRSDQATAQNYIYHGGASKTDTYTEADIEGLDESQITNDNTQVWAELSLGAEYVLFAQPDRLATPSFWDNGTGFAADMSGLGGTQPDPDYETVSVTNTNGFTEDYKVWRSSNLLGPGNFTLETK